MRHTGSGSRQQAAELPDSKAAFPASQALQSQVLQEVLRRVDKPFAAFFRRVATGGKPGSPRFKRTSRSTSLPYPQSGFALAGWQGWGKERYALLSRSKLGDFKVRLQRPMGGQVKTCPSTPDVKHRYVTCACEGEEAALPPGDEAVGIDLGLRHFATRSRGAPLEDPRPSRRGLKRLKRLSQIKDRRKLRRHRRKRAALALAKAQRTVGNQRKAFQQKAARALVNRFGLIVFEDLQILTLSAAPEPRPDSEHEGAYLPNGASAKAGLNTSILDAGWGAFQP